MKKEFNWNEYRKAVELYEHNGYSKDMLTESTIEGTPSNEQVPYTQQDEMFQSITQAAKTQFGATFSEQPMMYHPQGSGEANEVENVTLTGSVPSLENAQFQYKLYDSAGGCYVWGSPLRLNKENLDTLSLIYAVYENWTKELKNQDIKPMGLRNNLDDQQQAQMPQPQQNMVPGDDIQQ